MNDITFQGWKYDSYFIIPPEIYTLHLMSHSVLDYSILK